MQSFPKPPRIMADKNKEVKPLNRLAGDGGFKNQTLFVTGGTGFMGKVLVEKILRSCPLVKKIYLLVRTKKGKDPQSRVDELFAGPLFDLLKETRGDGIIKKVISISGDVTTNDLGLSKEDRQLVAKETDIIFHLAATVRFDEPFKKAILLNTRGTKFMLEFAKECKKLSIFAHISTAYCHLKERVLYERTYPPPADPFNVIRTAEWLDEDLLDSISHKIMGDYPNTYAFSKALAEGLVNEEMCNLPIIILRLPVVIPIWREPIPGWTDNINGPVGLLIAAGKGVLRTMYCDAKGYADYLPVDIAANAIMLAVYDYKTYKMRRIYNCTSSFEHKVTWAEIVEMGRKIVETRMPLNGVVWYPGGSLTRCKYYHYIRVILFHYLPAIVLDAIIFLSGNKPVLWRVQQRITKGFEVFEYYANNQWDFSNEQALKMRDWMSETENEIYRIDGTGVDIMNDYFYECIHAARLYVLKEGDDTLPAARRHMKIMWALDKLCKGLFLLGFFYFLFIYSVHYFIDLLI